MGTGKVGIQAQGLGILGHCLIHLALCGQGNPQVVMGQGQIRVNTQGLGILGHSLIHPALLR